MDVGRPLVDWRSAAAYAILATCDRHAFAWEWLRRSPTYLRAYCKGDDDEVGAAAFGLCRFEPLRSGVPIARPIWRADADPHVLTATAAPARDGKDVFDFAVLGALSSCVVDAAGAEHWLWSDGIRHIRLDILEGSLADGPVRLDYRIAGFAAALPRNATLRRLIALTRTGRIVPRTVAAEARAQRWSLVLRTHDALMAGASQRTIAEQLFGMDSMPRWRIESPSYRSRVQRLVGAARVAAQMDPRVWLQGIFP